MFERFSESARRALFFSRYAVTELGGATIEPEHLVLGVLKGAPHGIARFLRAGETLEIVRASLEAASAAAPHPATSVEIPFSVDTRDALQQTAAEADDLKNHWILPEHIVLGVMVKTAGAAARILREAGVEIDAVRNHLRSAPHDQLESPATVASLPFGVISRQWTGVVKPGKADEYVEHLRRETLPALQRLDGFVTAGILRRDVEDGTEFQVMTLWRSLDAIRAFAGEDITRAVVPPEAQALMVRYDERAVHYEIVR